MGMVCSHIDPQSKSIATLLLIVCASSTRQLWFLRYTGKNVAARLCGGMHAVSSREQLPMEEERIPENMAAKCVGMPDSLASCVRSRGPMLLLIGQHFTSPRPSLRRHGTMLTSVPRFERH